MKRDIVTIDDLSDLEIKSIFDLASSFLDTMKGDGQIEAVRGRNRVATDRILATLFYEPSTRTRLSFESAMIRMGGHVITAADAKATSAAKGETIADTVRVVQNYADIIVIRHPLEGAAKVAAEYASGVPVVNAGDGSHEHPTQTLCDLFTLTRGNVSLQGVNVLICGDLKNGRTVHSLVYGLARFGANILFRAAPGFELPMHVSNRLQREYKLSLIPYQEFDRLGIDEDDIGGIYVTPQRPNQLAVIPAPLTESFAKDFKRKDFAKYDVCYVTRLQMERLENSSEERPTYPVVNADFLNKKQYKGAKLLHPLPRVDELSYELDNDKRQAYFQQAAHGVPVRMALIAGLLGIKSNLMLDTPSQKCALPLHAQNIFIECQNPKCVLNDHNEKKYLKKKFWIIKNTEILQQRVLPGILTDDGAEPPYLVLRCYYCETEFVPEVVGSMSTRAFTNDLTYFDSVPPNLVTFFMTAEAGTTFGFKAFEFNDHYARRNR